MKIIYVHHALRKRGNPPSQNDRLETLGIKDAKITAKLLKHLRGTSNFKAIYTSPYYRCVKTAEIINKHINVSIYEEPRFNEFNKVFEILNGDETVQKTETWEDCQLRIKAALKDIVFKYNDKDIVVCVTSGVNIAAFICTAFKIKPSNNIPFPLVASCSPIGFEIDKSYFEE